MLFTSTVVLVSKPLRSISEQMFWVWIGIMCVHWCFQCKLLWCVCTDVFSVNCCHVCVCVWTVFSVNCCQLTCHVCGAFRLSCCELSNYVCECWCFQREWVPVVQLAESAGGHSAHGAVPVWPQHQQVDEALHQAGWRHPHRGCGRHWTQCGGGEHRTCCAEFWKWFCLMVLVNLFVETLWIDFRLPSL